jgi:DNA-binding FadR family transcriptional regulator
VTHTIAPGDPLPTLAEISTELKISVGKLREQVEYARQLELISVRPRVGMHREPFSFLPAVLPMILLSMATGEATFTQISQLRQALEIGLWDQAVSQLDSADIADLRTLIATANRKLNAQHIQIPYSEHRQFHLGIFRRLENPFVQGLLEAYWEAYEAAEITRYMRYEYWSNVWAYHAKIVDHVADGDFAAGREALIAHFNLLKTTSNSMNGSKVNT